MNKIKAKIYYEKASGNVIYVTSEMLCNMATTTKEQDIKTYPELLNKNIDEIEFIELEYGTLVTTFKNVKSYSIVNKKLNLVYYTQEELDEIQQEQEVKQAILDRITNISDYASLDNNSIDILENAIIEYETNLIINEVN